MDYTPMEHARKAFNEALDLADLLRSYAENPTDPDDLRKGLGHVIAAMDQVTERLESVQPLSSLDRREKPPAELIAALNWAENEMTIRSISTSAKGRTSFQVDVDDLRRSIRSATPDED